MCAVLMLASSVSFASDVKPQEVAIEFSAEKTVINKVVSMDVTEVNYTFQVLDLETFIHLDATLSNDILKPIIERENHNYFKNENLKQTTTNFLIRPKWTWCGLS